MCHRPLRPRRPSVGRRLRANGQKKLRSASLLAAFPKAWSVGLRTRSGKTWIAGSMAEGCAVHVLAGAALREGCLPGQADRRRIDEGFQRARVVGNAEAWDE